MNSNDHVISALLAEINEMQLMVTYYENRITRKLIAAEEILQGRECAEIKSIPHVQPGSQRNGHEITVRDMVLVAVDALIKTPFWYSDIKTKVLGLYPEHDREIRALLHPVCHELLNSGHLRKVSGGMERNK